MGNSRREFLKSTAMAGLGVSLSANAQGVAGTSQVGYDTPRSLDEIFARSIVVDAMSGFTPDSSQPDGGFKVIEKAGVTIVSPTLGEVVPAQSYESALRELSQLALVIAAHPERMMWIRNRSDVDLARKENKLGILVNFQNSTAIGTDLSNLDLFYGLGLRQIQLTFNWRNWVGDGCTERTQAGLSYFGVDLVHKMNDLGIIVDVSHSGYQTTLDAIEVSRKPIVFSHANCKALNDHPRNKTDDQIRALAGKGGVMGISNFNWFVSSKPRSTFSDLLDHFDHAIQLVGPDHVGMGSDFGLPGWAATEPDKVWEEHAKIYGEREWKALQGRFPPFIKEVNDEMRYRTIGQGLKERGYSLSDIQKVLGLNFARVYREILTG